MADIKISLTRDDFQEVADARSSFVPCDLPTHPHFRNLEGKSFNRLHVVMYAGRLGKKAGNAYFCTCQCGGKTVALGEELTGGNVKSCGCLNADMNRQLRQTHGRSGDREWRIWAGIKTRCTNPNSKAYPDYGGRGIKVCKRWVTGTAKASGFECFIADMGNRPSPKHSIDRINNNGNYGPRNCQWILLAKQPRNTRKTCRITYQGRTLSNWEWAEIVPIDPINIWKRIYRGWSVERTMTQPVRKFRSDK